MRAGRNLRRIVKDRIIAQVPDLGGRVYDRATEGVGYPYATMGPSDWVEDDADCIEGRSMSLQVDVWHSASNKGVCEDLVDDISAALKGWAGTGQIAMHPVEITQSRVLDDPSGDVHGVVIIEAMIEGA